MYVSVTRRTSNVSTTHVEREHDARRTKNVERQKVTPARTPNVRGAPLSPMNPEGAPPGNGERHRHIPRVEGVAHPRFREQTRRTPPGSSRSSTRPAPVLASS